ncbi:MAG: GxxExxY protein [Calditrichaeota bacterium]|nr:GxxExxY protein [Calditrichota bacterium]
MNIKDSEIQPIIYPDESYKIMGACFNVYRKMGSGFLEPVYQECLEIEFTKQNIPFEKTKDLRLMYDGIPLKHRYQADFVCYNKIILELKAVSKLTPEHQSQVLNYLNATGYKLGILINFGRKLNLESKRIVL